MSGQLASADTPGVLRRELRRVVDAAGGRPVSIKDPRIGVMAAWEPIIADCLHPVLVLRDPLEIALSIRRRDGTPVAFGLAAWELHLAGLLRILEGQTATVIPHRALQQAEALGPRLVEAATTHLEPQRAAMVSPAGALGAFEPSLYRNRGMDDDHELVLTPHQLRLWSFLSSMEPGDRTIRAPGELRAAEGWTRSAVAAETERQTLLREHGGLADELAAERRRTEERERELAAEHERELSAERTRSAEHEQELAAERTRAAECESALLADHARAERERARLEGTLEAITTSKSWRLTAPMRAARGQLSRRSG